jgi:hypothetical protein
VQQHLACTHLQGAAGLRACYKGTGHAHRTCGTARRPGVCAPSCSPGCACPAASTWVHSIPSHAVLTWMLRWCRQVKQGHDDAEEGAPASGPCSHPPGLVAEHRPAHGGGCTGGSDACVTEHVWVDARRQLMAIRACGCTLLLCSMRVATPMSCCADFGVLGTST